MFGMRIASSIAATIILATACGPEPLGVVVGTPGDTLQIAVNQQLEIALQNIGPGEYLSPPTITSESDGTVLRFLDAALACPCPPAGIRQRFRFEGRTRGVATVAFRQSYNDRVVTAVVSVH